MELKEITSKLKSIPNGANIGITYKSDISKQLNASAKKEGHTIEKEGRVVLRKGLKKDRDPENIPGDRSWGKHSSEEENTTNGESFIIEHNGKYYVDFYMGSAGGVGIQAPKYRYFLDGKEVTKEELEPYMQPAAYKRMNAPHNHYSINIDHISDVRYKGRTLEGLNEALDEETYFDFEHEIYGALVDVIYKYKGVTADEIGRALENFEIRFFEDGAEEEIFDEPLDDELEESYDDYEGGFNDPLESGEYSLSDFGYKNSYTGDHFTSTNKRTPEYHSGARRLTKDLNRNNKFSRAANESLRTSSNGRKLNEHISDSAAQKYGYRNAAELKAANSLNENLKKSK